MTIGTFGGGAPRFSIWDNSGNEAWIYWGTSLGGGSFSDPNAGTWANTGNYADLLSSDIRVYSDDFGGDNDPNVGVTWSQFVGLVGTTQVAGLSLDLDNGWSQAGGTQMQVNNFAVNDNVYSAVATPEPNTSVMLLTAIGLFGIALVLRRPSFRQRILR
jgi:hypothetical protein